MGDNVFSDEDFDQALRAQAARDRQSGLARRKSELRDIFAGNALAGIIGSESAEYGLEPDEMSANAYMFADAMLRAREHGQ